MTHPSNIVRARRLAAGLALGAGLIAAAPMAAFAADEKKNESGFIERMDRWQNEMTDKFRDTWHKLWGEKKGGSMSEQSIATASVDLREQKDSYTVRLNLPKRDLGKVKVKFEGDTLKIVAPAEQGVGRYEQVVALTGVKSGAEPKIERQPRNNLIVITVPKSEEESVAKNEPSITLPDPALLPLTDWDRDIFARMEKMQRDMDYAFDEAFRVLRTEPAFKGYFDEPRFGSALDLQEEGGNYVVRAYLPDRAMSNVNVTVEGQTLKLEAKEQEATKKEEKGEVLHSSRKAAYSQVLTLPGPVKSDKMRVDRKEGMLVVTLPKAK
jgi:HSP20 family molecular chaperone IbpA